MVLGRDEDAQRRRLQQVLADAQIGLEELWLRYFSLGGSGGQFEIEAYIHGATALPAVQRDLLAQALNELVAEFPGPGFAPYSRSMSNNLTRGPLAALVKLLGGMENAPPERLPRIAADAGRFIGVDVAIYLADFSQSRLIPLLADARRPAEVLDVETTQPGRAYRELRAGYSGSDQDQRLWVPLLNGAEPLGVVGYALASESDVVSLRAPGLLEQCLWLTHLLARVVMASDSIGDALRTLRHRAPTSPAAELIRQLLPPRAASTETLTVAGALEQAAVVTGEIYDYSLSETTAAIGLLAHPQAGNDGGLRTAVAVSAYRAARRNGAGVAGQAAGISAALNSTFPRGAALLGVLAEIRLATGEVNYRTAGGPEPLLLTSNGTAKTLVARPLPPGDAADPASGIKWAGRGTQPEILQPGDWLVLCSGSVEQALDAGGRAVGRDRLADLVRREMREQRQPAEAARRILRQIADDGEEGLARDVALVIARWDGNSRRS